MTQQQIKSTRIPAPLYAAAGAGDLAYQQLKKLPTVMGELSGRAVAGGFELRERAVASLKVAESTATTWRDRARDKAVTTDLETLRTTATSSAVAFAQAAQAAQERALAVYTALVSHGERVVGAGVVQAADTVNADIESTEEPKAVSGTPADVADKPRATKRTRAAVK